MRSFHPNDEMLPQNNSWYLKRQDGEHECFLSALKVKGYVYLYLLLVNLVTLRDSCQDAQFADDVTKAQRGDVTCPKMQSWCKQVL